MYSSKVNKCGIFPTERPVPGRVRGLPDRAAHYVDHLTSDPGQTREAHSRLQSDDNLLTFCFHSKPLQFVEISNLYQYPQLNTLQSPTWMYGSSDALDESRADGLRRFTTSTATALPPGWVRQQYTRWLQQTDGNAATQAAPLVTSPTMIVALLSPEVREATSTYHNPMSRIESLNCHSFGSLLFPHSRLHTPHPGRPHRAAHGVCAAFE